MSEPRPVVVGTRLTPLRKRPTTRQLVQYAGAVEDFNEQHYDWPFVQRLGLPDVLLHGSLQAAWLAQLAERFAEGIGRVVCFDARYVHLAHPGAYLCQGEVVGRKGEDVELLLWGENANGVRCTEARAIVHLTPSPVESTRKSDTPSHDVVEHRI